MLPAIGKLFSLWFARLTPPSIAEPVCRNNSDPFRAYGLSFAKATSHLLSCLRAWSPSRPPIDRENRELDHVARRPHFSVTNPLPGGVGWPFFAGKFHIRQGPRMPLPEPNKIRLARQVVSGFIWLGVKQIHGMSDIRLRFGNSALGGKCFSEQQLSEASEHLQVALALFPLGAEANELMALVFLQVGDGHSAIRSFDAVASQKLPVSFYAEMRGHKLDHATKCELTQDHVRLIFLSSYDKKGITVAPDKQAGDDGLGDMTLLPSDDRQPFDSLELNLSDIKKVETNKGLLIIKLPKQEFTLAPIYLPSYTPVEGPPAGRFANDYTRLFIRYPGLEDSKLGAEGMTGGEKFAMGYKLATAGVNIATNLNPIGAIQATRSAIFIARTIHSAMASLNVSLAAWQRSVNDQQQLFGGNLSSRFRISR